MLKESSDSVNVFSKVALAIAILAMAMLIILLASRFCMCGKKTRPQVKQERKRILRQNESSGNDESSSDSGSDDDEDEPNDVELASVASGSSRRSRNAMDLIQDHKGIAMSRQAKVKQAISSRLPQAQGIRSSFSNINVNARKHRARRASRDKYDEVVDFRIDDEDDEGKEYGYNDEESSVENNINIGEEDIATAPKKHKEATDLLDIPMIT